MQKPNSKKKRRSTKSFVDEWTDVLRLNLWPKNINVKHNGNCIYSPRKRKELVSAEFSFSIFFFFIYFCYWKNPSNETIDQTDWAWASMCWKYPPSGPFRLFSCLFYFLLFLLLFCCSFDISIFLSDKIKSFFGIFFLSTFLLIYLVQNCLKGQNRSCFPN